MLEKTSGPTLPIGIKVDHNNTHSANNATQVSMIGPLSYIGGKRAIAKPLIALFPDHTTYVEAFAGGAQVFFHKERSKVEVLNDLDGEIVNFYRVCQQHYEELIRYFRFMVRSRAWHALLKATDPNTLTDIQRAARYMYLLKNCYAGLVRNMDYSVNVAQPPSFNLERLPDSIAAAHERLARVQIESLPYEQVLKRYDRPKTFFYLDPPYYDRKLYRHNLEPEDFANLAERLKTLQGKFLLSLNDVPQVRALFGEFKIHGIDLHYTAQKAAGRRYRELIIMNY